MGLLEDIESKRQEVRELEKQYTQQQLEEAEQAKQDAQHRLDELNNASY